MAYAWEVRVYLDQRTLKATAVSDPGVVKAWFAANTWGPFGPFGVLPGLTLMVTNPASRIVYGTNHVELSVLSHAIEPPSRGRKVSEQLYRRTKGSGRAEDYPLVKERSGLFG